MNTVLNLGPHAAYIWAAYGASALVLGGLIGWIRTDARQQIQLLEDLEARGIRRRSARSPARSPARKPAKSGKGRSQ